MQVYTGNPSSDDDGFRERYTEFLIDQSAPIIQAFYRAELSQRGWTFRCTVGPTDPPCGRSGWTEDTDLLDVYDRGTIGTVDWQTLEARILLPDAIGTRLVRLTEYGVGGPAFIADTPATALVGQWRAADGTADRNFILRMLPDGHVTIVLPRTSYGGQYQLSDDNALQLIFAARTARVVGEHGDGWHGLCTNAPSLFKSACHTTLVPPAAYPGPNEVRLPMSTAPVRIGPPATPAPASLPTPERGATVMGDSVYPGPPTPTLEPREDVDSQIDAPFAVALDGDTLRLTNASGMTQTFRRVGGN